MTKPEGLDLEKPLCVGIEGSPPIFAVFFLIFVLPLITSSDFFGVI